MIPQRLIWLFARGGLLVALWAVLAQVPAWRRPLFPQPAPREYGAAIGYGLGGVGELDMLGAVWYLDYDFGGTAFRGHPRLLLAPVASDLDRVARAARRNGGAWWQFGNEPNDPNQDNVSPEEYARRFHDFYFALKQADPQARVVAAGIANADWKWALAFRDAYRSRFGRYPALDGWSIHDYLLDSCEEALDVQAFQARILAFRSWMVGIGDADKPLLLTEYGVLYGNGCCGCPRIPEGQVVAFMQATSRWMQESRTVSAWAWFAVNTHNRYNGDLFLAETTLTPFGQAYRDLVNLQVRP